MKVTKGVYCLTSPNGKRYVGYTCDIRRRWDSYKRLACKSQTKIYNALKKYGPENFKYEVVLETDDMDNAARSEMYLIDVWNLQDDRYGYNILPGGETGTRGMKASDSSKQKMREAKIGKKLSEQTKNKMSIAQKGISKPKPDGFGEKLSKIKKGYKLSDEHKKNISIAMTGKHRIPFTDKHKKKISDSKKGKMIGIKHPNYKLRKFQNIQTGQIVECGIYEGSDIYGWEPSNIIRRKSSNGWRLINE